jgi:MscS family membrane protein
MNFVIEGKKATAEQESGSPGLNGGRHGRRLYRETGRTDLRASHKMTDARLRRRFVLAAGLLVALIFVLAHPGVCPAQVTVPPPRTKQEKASSTSILPSPEKVSPIHPEMIEGAVQKLEHEVQDIGSKASQTLGRWLGLNVFLGVTWLSLIVCLLVLLLVGILDHLARTLIERRVRTLSTTRKSLAWMALVLDALSKPLSLFIWVYGIYGALSISLVQLRYTPGLEFLPGKAGKAADIGGAIAIIWLIYRLAVLSDVRVKTWAGASHSKIDQLLVGIVGKSLRIVIVLIGSIMVIQNLTGIQMGPLIASLGLGGLAIALAAKDSVANFLGTLTIIFDKPFQIGDQVAIDKYEGIVESVGFRSTRIRTADGHLLSMPNSKMIDSPLQNVGRRPNIRWFTNIGISYETPPEKVRRAVEIIEEILRDHEGMREDFPPRIFFDAFKDWSLNISIRAWYHPPEQWAYQAWLQETCMEILQRFHSEGIRFALPAKTLRLANGDKGQSELQMLKGEQTETSK